MMAKRLRHATKPFASHRHDRFVVLLGLLARHSFNIVADQSDWTLGLQADTIVQWKQLLNFIDELLELFVATKNNILFLKVRRELHGDKGFDTRQTDVIVAALRPGIVATTDGPMRYMDHILDRPPHDTLRAGISAAANGHHARNGLDVGFHPGLAKRIGALLGFLSALRHAKVLFAALSRLIRILGEYLIYKPGVEITVVLVVEAHRAFPLSKVRMEPRQGGMVSRLTRFVIRAALSGTTMAPNPPAPL
ncbi:hypothetical protein ABIA10_007583 [Rhizobium leguminosarum]